MKGLLQAWTATLVGVVTVPLQSVAKEQARPDIGSSCPGTTLPTVQLAVSCGV